MQILLSDGLFSIDRLDMIQVINVCYPLAHFSSPM